MRSSITTFTTRARLASLVRAQPTPRDGPLLPNVRRVDRAATTMMLPRLTTQALTSLRKQLSQSTDPALASSRPLGATSLGCQRARDTEFLRSTLVPPSTMLKRLPRRRRRCNPAQVIHPDLPLLPTRDLHPRHTSRLTSERHLRRQSESWPGNQAWLLLLRRLRA